ncbi:MAG TPA: HlyD family efflux transporter periplasmic adaptor subunit [Blastocatellia bacterium]|nr:HlyD family efflux transporter periplasmic adaptor subunit [Blastocatellia bacterium]
MSATFSDTMRSLSLDRFRPSIVALLLVMVVLLAWLVWFARARVSVYEVSTMARLEAGAAVHPVVSSGEGRVVLTRLVVGNEVRAGDVLVEIESEAERLRLADAKTRLAMLAPQHATLREQLSAELSSLDEQLKAARISIDEARKRSEEADAAALYAKGEAERFAGLSKSGLLSEADLARARAEEQQRRSAAEAVHLAISRLETEMRSKERAGQARLETLRREIAEAAGQASATTSLIDQLSFEIERRQIKAPVGGRIGEAAELRPGAVVRAGDRMAAIIPAGDVKVVAFFPPARALGHIRQGQKARLRLEGFPWTQYGVVRAVVDSIANEPRDGTIRVDLNIQYDSASAIPLQHGLPGSVEIEVDRVSPAALLLRVVGKRFSFAPESQEAR